MSTTLPDNIILQNAIRTLTDVDFIIIGMPTTEADISTNVRWIVETDSTGAAVYGDNSAVTAAQIKAKFDELKG